jgi:hypothetical protein
LPIAEIVLPPRECMANFLGYVSFHPLLYDRQRSSCPISPAEMHNIPMRAVHSPDPVGKYALLMLVLVLMNTGSSCMSCRYRMGVGRRESVGVVRISWSFQCGEKTSEVVVEFRALNGHASHHSKRILRCCIWAYVFLPVAKRDVRPDSTGQHEKLDILPSQRARFLESCQICGGAALWGSAPLRVRTCPHSSRPCQDAHGVPLELFKAQIRRRGVTRHVRAFDVQRELR